MNEYQKAVEAFRHFYKVKYDVDLDDVTIYFFIRVNEVQHDLRKEIARIPQVRFKSGWDYFLYGLGAKLHWVIIAFFVMLFTVALVS